MSGALLALLAGLVMGSAGLRWLALMQAGRIPRDVTRYLASSALGVLLGVAALLRGAGVIGGVIAALAALAGAAFLALYAASGQRRGAALAVGDRVLDFTARDADGRSFTLSSLDGRPFLLKFFRGHWCPYCVAELRRWRELTPELAARGITIVALCADTVDEIRKHRVKHGLDALLLADPELVVTDLYGLRNPRNFAPRPGVIIPLPVPTTILVDGAGIVRWIDQSADYMRRSDPAVVRAAIAATLDADARATPPRAAGTWHGVAAGPPAQGSLSEGRQTS